MIGLFLALSLWLAPYMRRISRVTERPGTRRLPGGVTLHHGLPLATDSQKEAMGNQKCLGVLKEKEMDLKRVLRITN